MATVYQGTIVHGGFHPTQGFRAWVSRRLAALIARQRHAREMADLAAFSDCDLWDLGLSRSDLMAVERGLYRRD